MPQDDTAVTTPNNPFARTPPPAEVLAGRYRLVRCVGTGGMGEVYEAEQLAPVRRTVAVKLVRGGPDGYDIAARLEAERQALARMAHPHIAVVHDGGTAPDGRPFVVMEFVNGVPLTDYADDHKLGLRGRVDLVRQICLAVQHAHQKGVIHRDLKPGNILVAHTDAGPVPKVIDFGLAKAVRVPLTDARMTTAGMIVGTPLYMAPEQTDPAADVDTRADVYALGVVLFELLTGDTPIDRLALRSAEFHEQMKRVRTTFAPPPSTKAPPSVARQIRGDLDAVTLKALARHPDDRYPTAAALAEDLGHILADEPLSVGRGTVWGRAARFARRNRAAVVAAVAVFVALAVGGALATVGFVRSRSAEADTRAALRKVEDQTAALSAALAKVEAERNKVQTARDRVRAALEAATGLNAIDLVTHAPELTTSQRDHLTRLAALIAGLETDAAEPAERAAWLGRVGLIHEKLGDQPKAADAYARAVAASTEPMLRAGHLQKQARHFTVLGRWADAEAAYREVLAVVTPFLPRNDVRRGLIDANDGLATALHRLGRADEARAAAHAAVALADAVRAGGEPLGLDALPAAQSHTTLGMLAGGKPEDDLAHNQAALDILRASTLDPADSVVVQKLAAAHLNMSPALLRLGRFAEAAAAAREAVRVAEGGLARYPGLLDLRVVLGTATNNLGSALAALRETTEAAAQFEKAIDILAPLAARPGFTNDRIRHFLRSALLGRGTLRADKGDDDGADADFRRAIDLHPPPEREGLTMYLVGQALRQKQPGVITRFAEHYLADGGPGTADRASYLFALCTLMRLPEADLDRHTASAIRAIRRVPADELPTLPLQNDPRLYSFRKRPGVADALAGVRPPEAPPPRARQ